jgi:hypothetical protein
MIHSSYSIGAVNGRSQGNGNRGAFVGIAGRRLRELHGVTGQSDAQMKSALPSGFRPKIWGQDPNLNNGYPYLSPIRRRIKDDLPSVSCLILGTRWRTTTSTQFSFSSCPARCFLENGAAYEFKTRGS